MNNETLELKEQLDAEAKRCLELLDQIIADANQACENLKAIKSSLGL